MSLKRIAITMGDPAGVGPELCLRILSSPEIGEICHPIVFGSEEVLNRVATKLGWNPPSRVAYHPEEIEDSTQLLNCFEGDLDQVLPGKVNSTTGRASFQFIRTAIDACVQGLAAAVVTCPIHKEAWQSAGIQYPGHTEYFAERNGTDDFCMMMTAPAFSCSLVTTHVGYREVPDLLSIEQIIKVSKLTWEALEKILGRHPNLMMLGLNPHAGEGGLFGNFEEEKFILPAVERLRELGIPIEGPVPPDTAFLKSKRDQIDGYVCMYHDQGLIPFKALNFDTGVNVTLGLKKLVRTSVDHGTALDIAWKGVADVSSLVSAVNLAAKLVG